MPVLITCPTCGAEVRLLPDGHVKVHRIGGALCSFVRTASSASVGQENPFADPVKRQALQERRALLKVQEAAAKEREKRSKELRKKRAQADKALRDKLQLKQKIDGLTRTDRRKRKKTKGGGSVWTISGGLPSLGKRN
ncbi:hypothetical protein [Naasia lichenicola]|uniref:Uncharacterized protein n=1 Tax=Naasia lichenicola TaxID=2565933 RepID=A0A4V3WTU0_9MICO|nr:hypothetical protein [Naasia lichenicola]THG33257.1 hypothetical protein E6C64_02585 [Naasia lichenicola]